LPDIAHELFIQIFGAGEDTSGNDIALDAGKPVFDLVEPGRIGRREMHRDLRMFNQKRLNRSGFVTADVVTDHVNLTACRLLRNHNNTIKERNSPNTGHQ
jgi:hypothetical protein